MIIYVHIPIVHIPKCKCEAEQRATGCRISFDDDRHRGWKKEGRVIQGFLLHLDFTLDFTLESFNFGYFDMKPGRGLENENNIPVVH